MAYKIRKSEFPGNKTPYYVVDTDTGIVQRQCANFAEAWLTMTALEAQQEAGR
jgi:hypothetical protein